MQRIILDFIILLSTLLKSYVKIIHEDYNTLLINYFEKYIMFAQPKFK